jgi:Uma2 family endonuclease
MSIAPHNFQIHDRNRRLITVDEYERMGETGLLRPDERTELIEGELIQVTPMGSRHAASISRLTRFFQSHAGNHLHVRVQLPIKLGLYNEPEPDVALVFPRSDDYESAHPTAQDVLVIIEVSDTTLKFDQRAKLPMYARHSIPEVWIVDLANSRIQVCTEPSESGYGASRYISEAEAIVMSQVPGLYFAVSELFPRG